MNTKIQKKSFQRTVLIVDDEAINSELLGSILQTEYDVLYAGNGKEAISIIEEKRSKLSLILLDIIMPELDGYAVLNHMRIDPVLSKIPVIVLTADKTAEIRSLKMGAADFLSKPYDLPEAILARVSHSIELFEDKAIIQATEYDSLTGLFTLEFFFEYANQMSRYDLNTKKDYIVINFNRFHIVGELYGKEISDSVLKHTGKAIKNLILNTNGIACRHSTDEFYVYLDHTIEYKDLLAQINDYLLSQINLPEISFRMGIYNAEDKDVSIETKYSRASQACATLRETYETSFAVYDMDMHQKEMYSACLLSDFEKALQQRQFKVSYQPKYNIKGEKPYLASAEALVSWMHPEFGRVRPDDFIPLFEKNGMIKKLDRYVWEEAAKQIRTWKDKFGVTVPLSVNVSRVDMYAPDILDFIKKIVKENNLEPKEYYLEVTESAYTDNSDQIIQVVNSMRDAGFRIEMDDFGSGYSSLNMLSTLPIDVLKLDMAFIRNIKNGNKEMRMVELMLDIAKYLKVPVVAEGVETEEQYKLLKDAGCDIIQGYYFSKPLLAPDFDELIKKEKQVQ